MRRNALAVLAGFIVGTVLYQVGAALAFVVLYGIPLGATPGEPGVAYYSLNLGFATLAAVLAGSTATRVAKDGARVAAGIVGFLLALLALWGFTKPTSNWPAWYAPVLAVVAIVGTLTGARLKR